MDTHCLWINLCHDSCLFQSCDYWQAWSTLPSTHYITRIQMSNQLGLFEYICVKNCLILVVFLISQPWMQQTTCSFTAVHMSYTYIYLCWSQQLTVLSGRGTRFGTTQTDCLCFHADLARPPKVPHECLDKATDEGRSLCPHPLRKLRLHVVKTPCFQGWFLRMKHPPHSRQTMSSFSL